MNRSKYLLYSLIFITISFSSCKQNPEKAVDKQKKVLEKQEIEKKKSEKKGIERGKKRHLNIQTKETRKRMKQSAKKSKNGGQPKKKFFVLRWFGA